MGKKPLCNQCKIHHQGECKRGINCTRCGKKGHEAKECRALTPRDQQATDTLRGCYECGKPGHFKRNCPQLKSTNNDHEKEEQVLMLEVGNVVGDEDGITGKFLMNNHHIIVLFDTGVDWDFVCR